MKKSDIKKAAEAKETFRRLYNLFRRKGGFEDTFEDHPGWNQKSGKDNLTPWDRLVIATKGYSFDLNGYIFTTLKKIMEDSNPKNLHPHFLLKQEYLDEYQHTYPTLVRSIEIKWKSQMRMFDAELKYLDTMPWFGEASLEEKQHYILLAENKRFTDLFIFDKAVSHGFERLANEVIEAAKFEYSLFASVYDSLIKQVTILERLK